MSHNVSRTFNSFNELFRFFKTCPICASLINDFKCFISRASFTEFNEYLEIKDPDLDLIINLKNNNVDIVERTYKYNKIWDIGSNSSYILGYSNYAVNYIIVDDVLTSSYSIHCINECYNYVINLHISLNQRKLVNITIDSETVFIDDNNDVHEISNCYPEMKTYYKCISKQKNFDKIQIPLISNTLTNPLESYNRIKNMLIYI